MRIKQESSGPEWTPTPGDKASRAKWLHEWFDGLPEGQKIEEGRRRSKCCRDLKCGRMEQDGYYVRCSNCDREISVRTKAEPEDFKKAQANDNEVPF